ncbi:MAG: ABC transporter permease [Candidatus Krumholzibacteriia bacterium]
MTILPALTLTQRELVRFSRQRSRMVGALGPPLLFWFLIGSGLGDSFRPSGAPPTMTSLEYLFPGTVLLIVLFTAIFSTISIIEDRREGFLQSVLVAPASRGGLVLGKMLGGTLLAILQVILVLLLAPLMGFRLGLVSFLATVGTLLVISFGFTGLGFLIAWRLDSTQGFHAIMNLFLMPMWILSGALFPAAGSPGWLRAIMFANPMSHALDSLRQALYFGSAAGVWGTQTGSFGAPLIVSALFALLMLVAALHVTRQPRAADLHG